MDKYIRSAEHIVCEGGQFYLLYADETGVYERSTRDFVHYSESRPLIREADRAGITGWASPHMCWDRLAVTVDTVDGRHGIRVFFTQEYMPGYSTFSAPSDVLTPPGWDCTDGILFSGFLFFTRRTEAGAEIWVQPLRSDVPMGDPYRLFEGECPVLWHFACSEGFVEPTAMLFFRNGRACLSKAASPYSPVWEEIPQAVETEGVSAAVFEDMDGSFMARILREDGTAHFCYLEWAEESGVLIPRDIS